MKCPRSIAALTVAAIGLFGGFALSVPAGAQQKPQSIDESQPGGKRCPPNGPSSVPIADPYCPPPECPTVPGGPNNTDCVPEEECPPYADAPKGPDCPGEQCPVKTWVDASGKAHVDHSCEEPRCIDVRKCPPPPECEGRCDKTPPGVKWEPKYTG